MMSTTPTIPMTLTTIAIATITNEYYYTSSRKTIMNPLHDLRFHTLTSFELSVQIHSLDHKPASLHSSTCHQLILETDEIIMACISSLSLITFVPKNQSMSQV